jgi:hypothetical protein
MILPEVFSVLGCTALYPFVITIRTRAFETGLVFLSAVAQKDLVLRKTFVAENTLEWWSSRGASNVTFDGIAGHVFRGNG